MGFVSDIVSGRSSSGYAELSDDDLATPPGTETQVFFADVTCQDDLVNAKQALHEGHMVLLDISYIESNGLSLDVVYGHVQEAVDTIGGDVVHKDRNDLLVATPRDITVSRTKL